MSLSNDYSYVSSSDNTYIDGLYMDFRRNPESVDTSWRQFFKGVEFAQAQAPSSVVTSPTAGVNLIKEFKVFRLIDAYRTRGHLISTTNPIRERKNRYPHLDLEDFSLTNADPSKALARSHGRPFFFNSSCTSLAVKSIPKVTSL